MNLKELQDAFNKALGDVGAIRAKYTDPAAMTSEDITAMDGHIKTAENIKAQIESQMKQDALLNWSKSSPGQLPLAGVGKQAGDVTVEGFTPAGQMVIERKDLSVIYDEGEGYVDQKTFELISSTDYKRAFKAYLRGGREGLKSNDLKVLQEGSDTQGGLAKAA